MRELITVKLCVVAMRDAILGNDLKLGIPKVNSQHWVSMEELSVCYEVPIVKHQK